MTRVTWLWLAVSVMTLCAVGGIAWLLQTTAGARWMTGRLLGLTLRPASVAFADVEGSVWHGWTVHHVVLEQPRILPHVSTLQVQRLRITALPRWRRHEPLVRMQRMQLHAGAGAWRATIQRLQSGIHTGTRAEQIEMVDWPRLPAASRLRIDAVIVTGAPHRWHTLEIHNGRLHVPGQDPVLAYGTVTRQHLDLHLYTETLNLELLLASALPSATAVPLTGTVDDVEAQVQGAWQHPELTGTFEGSQARYRDVRIENASGTTRWTWQRGQRQHLEAEGTVTASRGQVTVRHITAQLEPSRLEFARAQSAPQLRVAGATTIADVQVRIRLTGTADAPQWVLTSDPPLPQERLLLLVATGTRWAGTEQSLAAQRFSPDAGKELFDYLLFGGRGQRLAEHLGIDVSLLQQGQDQGLSLRTSITDKLKATVGMTGHTDDAAGTRHRQQLFGADYQMSKNARVVVEGTRDVEQTIPTEADTREQQPKVHRGMQLKYERRF